MESLQPYKETEPLQMPYVRPLVAHTAAQRQHLAAAMSSLADSECRSQIFQKDYDELNFYHIPAGYPFRRIRSECHAHGNDHGYL